MVELDLDRSSQNGCSASTATGSSFVSLFCIACEMECVVFVKEHSVYDDIIPSWTLGNKLLARPWWLAVASTCDKPDYAHHEVIGHTWVGTSLIRHRHGRMVNPFFSSRNDSKDLNLWMYFHACLLCSLQWDPNSRKWLLYQNWNDSS